MEESLPAAASGGGGDRDREADEWLERGDHPLMNDVVVNTVFGFVRRYDLMVCRGVCKKWNVRTIPRMRTSVKVKIHGHKLMNRLMNLEHDRAILRGSRKIDNFIQLFSSNELEFPFGKFQLGPFCTKDGVGQQFLQLCGETATEIDLTERFQIHTIEDVSEILRCSPNLKVLGCPSRIVSRSGNIVKLFPHSISTFLSLRKITFCSLYERERLEFCPTWIEELLTAAPNVSEVVAYDGWDYESKYEGNTGTTFVLNCIEKLGRESAIQSLELLYARTRHIDHIRRMTEKENGLKLKSLTFDLDDMDMTEDAFDKVLIELATILKDTLQHFSLGCGCYNVNWMEFPHMPKLKSLRFGLSSEFDFDPMQVNLNSYFPALEKLKIGFMDNIDWADYFSVFQFQSCPTIKSLNFESGFMRIPTFHNMLGNFGKFPNLTKLKFQLIENGVEVLRQIWTPLVQLESMSIRLFIKRTEYLDLDSLLTGIPTRTLRRIRPVGNELEKMSVEQRKERILELRNDHCRFPSICDLTNLRRLKLDVTGEVRRPFYTQNQTSFDRRKYRLTDLTAYLALYSMKDLSHLDVGPCTFTKNCCEILTKETGLESWSF